MTNKELKKLSRADLLELLLEERRENERLRAVLKKACQKLADKNISVQNAGSLAEAALALNGVFKAADDAAAQYLDNIKRTSGNSISDNADAKARSIISDANAYSQKTRAEADAYSQKTRAEADAYKARTLKRLQELLKDIKSQGRGGKA